jgi:hypothetical protein
MGRLATRESQAAEKRRRRNVQDRAPSTAREMATTPRTVQATPPLSSTLGAGISGGFNRENATAPQGASAPMAGELIVPVDEQLAEELIEEREEILEESGGASDETEELGDDPKEEIQEVKNSLRVLYNFNPTYTSGGFIESLNPDFRRIQGSRARKERAQAKLAARDSVLIAKVELKSGRTKLEDYKSMSRIDEPVLNLKQRRFVYKPAEKSKLRTILSRQPFDLNSVTNRINSFLDVPEFERVETPIIINKFEIENEFRLSPIDDAPPRFRIQSDVKSPPRLGSFTSSFARKVSREMKITTGIQITNGPRVGGGESGDGVRRDIDTGLIEEFPGARTFEIIDARREDPFESERVSDRISGLPGPPRGNPGSGGY